MKKVQPTHEVLNTIYGVQIKENETHFKVWTPLAKDVQLCVYKTAQSVRRQVYNMTIIDGIASYVVSENLTGQFYTYLIDGYEVVDPYVHSTSGNSQKGAIVDAKQINPEGFETHKRPKRIETIQSIIYEVHIKDFSVDERRFKHKGKYLSFTENHLTFEGHAIGVDHLVELGITHVHLLPVYDFLTANDYDENSYNWGYDPYLYNCPEGSYASDPDDPSSRILEFKQLIQNLHEHDIRVVLDVVYNHTYFGGTSNFHRLMPYVFHRFNKKGEWGNGSGCGNELDTEHPFVRKFIMDSLIFWYDVYKVDGFRFDLMGLYDVEFVKDMVNTLTGLNSDILLYGEPWVGGPTELENQLTKGDQRGLNLGLFNDDFRNAIKGSNDGEDLGFIGHGAYRKSDVYAGCFGSIKFNEDIQGFALKANETINYVSSHDNLILMDKFTKAKHHTPFEDRQNMSAMALGMVLLAFGIPFIQAGTEFLRSKYGDHNSYNSGININKIHWEYKKYHRHVFDFIKRLIAFRKTQKVFTLVDEKDIQASIHMFEDIEGLIRYEIKSPFKEDFSHLLIAYNGSDETIIFDVEDYELHIDGALYYHLACEVKENQLILPKYSMAVLVKNIDR